MLSGAKVRARVRGVPYNLEVDDIEIPEVCPVLGIPIRVSENHQEKDHSPSLDRLIPSLGYTKDNVAVISYRANRIKTDATPQELRAVADWFETQIAKHKL